MIPSSADRLAARERPSGHPALHMRWEGLLFLHWAWDPAEIQDTLPPGLTVDTWEDRAWLGVVPFFMRRVRPRGLPAVPWMSDFLELNVRTYVTDRSGCPGVWFYALLCNQPIAVEIARRLFHLNYLHADLRAEAAPAAASEFVWTERGAKPAGFRGDANGPFSPAAPETRAFFLVERYALFSADRRGRLFSGRVHHAPYAVTPARATAWSFRPSETLGFRPPGRPPDDVLLARPVEVDAWKIRPVR